MWGKAIPVKNRVMLVHWLTLLFQEGESKQSFFQGNWYGSQRFNLRLSDPFLKISAVLKGRITTDAYGNTMLRSRILPGTSYILKVLFVYTLLIGIVWTTFGFSLRILVPLTGLYLIVVHYLHWIASAKLRAIKKILKHVTLHDEFPED